MSLVPAPPQDCGPEANCHDVGHEWDYDFGWPPHDEPESRVCIHCSTVQYPYPEGWRR